MEFDYNNKPSLIGTRIKKSVSNIMKKSSDVSTISDKVTQIVMNFYDNYIYEFRFILLIIICFVVFLIYRYYNRTNKKREDFSNDLINTIVHNQTEKLWYNEQPSMNPLNSVRNQTEFVNYPPEPLPINLPNEGIVLRQDIYPPPPPFPFMNTPKYDYKEVNEQNSRVYSNGTFNTYKHAEDTNLINPLGFSNKFNTTTGNFIGEMTRLNKDNIYDYQKILDNTHGNLLDSLKIGPTYLDTSNFDTNIEPPYNTDL